MVSLINQKNRAGEEELGELRGCHLRSVLCVSECASESGMSECVVGRQSVCVWGVLCGPGPAAPCPLLSSPLLGNRQPLPPFPDASVSPVPGQVPKPEKSGILCSWSTVKSCHGRCLPFPLTPWLNPGGLPGGSKEGEKSLQSEWRVWPLSLALVGVGSRGLLETSQA
uniref:Uncharacterized protein n=1 Tax=Mustela putorius furo TaxID=9669 RepID=M3YHH4_MUSPF